MIWNERKENDVILVPYDKSDYLGLMNPKSEESFNDSNQKKKSILDLTEDFRIGMMIMSDWGPGKVVSVNKATKKVVLNIEGQERTFDMIELHSALQIYIHVYFKKKDLSDKRVIISASVLLDDTIEQLKKKIADIFGGDENKVIIVHGGNKLTDNKLKIYQSGIFYLDTLLVVINGTCDY